MDAHPVYAGAEFNSPRTPQPATPSVASPIQQAATSGFNKAMHEMSAIEQDTYNRMEYTLDQERKLYMAETLADIEAKSLRRLSLPNGHQDAFYDEKGKFRDAEFKSFLSDQKARFNGLEQGYIKPDSVLAARADIAKLKQKLTENLSLKIAANLSTRAKDSTLKLANYQADSGLFEDAIGTIKGAPPEAFQQVEKDSLILDFTRKSILNDAQQAIAANNPEAYYAIRYNKDLTKKLTPQQFAQLRNMESNFMDTDGIAPASMDDSMPSDDFFLNADSDDGSDYWPTQEESAAPSSRSKTKKSPSQAAGLPLGITDELVQLFDDVGSTKAFRENGEALRQAVAAFDNYAARYVKPNMTPDEKALLFNIAQHFAIKDETVNDIIQKYESTFGSNKEFNFQQSMDKLSKNTPQFFIPQALQRQISTATKNLQDLVSVDVSGLSRRKKEAHAQSLALARAQLTAASGLAEESKKDAEAAIRKAYTAWWRSLTDTQQKSLTFNQQKMKLFDLADKYMDSLNGGKYDNEGKWDFSQSIEYVLTQDKVEDEAQARDAAETSHAELMQEVKAVDEARAQSATEEEIVSAASAQSSAGQLQLSNNIQDAFKLDNTATQSFVAVPSGHALAGKSLRVSNRSRTRMLPCIAVDGIASPTLSLRARTNFRIAENDKLNIVYDSKGHAMFSSVSVPQREQNMYQFMLNHETLKGHIKVNKLLKADGGGEWEVAGINLTYHPAEAHKLRQMIEDGASQEELRAEVFAYYKEITDDIARIVNPASNSQGIELFLRDAALNTGAGGAQSILRRALNAPANANLATATSDFISRHGNSALLSKLRNARANYYVGIATRKPHKQQFLRGWLNRTQNAFVAASDLLNTPCE